MISEIKVRTNIATEDNVSFIGDGIIVGFPSQEQIDKIRNGEIFVNKGVYIGENALIRSGTVIYDDVRIGKNFKCGHNVIIRESTGIGHDVKVGTSSVIEGNAHIGSNTNIQSMVFIPTHSWIDENVFIGPRVTFTNDKYPPTGLPKLVGAIVGSGAVICASVTVLPGVKIGKNSFVAAGALVTKDVSDGMMAIGSPAIICEKPRGCECK